MKIKGHGTIKKSKAYGVIGTLLLSAALIVSFGNESVSADEVTNTSSNVIENVSNVENQIDSPLTETADSFTATTNDDEVSKSKETSEIVNETADDNQSNSASQSSTIATNETSDSSQILESDDVISDTSNEGNSNGVTSEQEKQNESTEIDNSESITETTLESSKQDQVTSDNQIILKADKKGATGSAATETTSAALTAKGFDLQYNEAITPGAKIMFAVWSEVNGQDDLIWYTADSNGHAIAKYTGTYGLYNIHTYQNLNGQMKGLNGRTIDVPKPSAKVSIVKASDTTYKVTVSDIPAYITSIQLPTWTEKGGQDDIQWYGTTYNSDGTFTKTFSVAEHNFESGQYNVHVYGTSAVTNSLTGLTGTSFQGDYKFGDVHVEASLGQNGINISMPSDVSSDITVYHAVWSAERDQDDIVWYKVPANGQMIAKYTGSYGTYLVHTYGVVKGQMVCLSATSIDVPKPSAKVSIVKESGTTYKVIVSDVPAYITSVQLPTWTAKNDQDDTIWYTAERQSDGTFTKTFSVAEHNFESGKYNVHYYGISSVTNTLTGLGGTSFNCDYQFGDIAITAKAGANGVEITMPQDIAKVANVSHAVWSKVNGQDDLKWYSDTTGHVVAPYTGDYGTYFVDTYANVKGQMICIGSTTIDIPKPVIKTTITKESEVSVKVTVSNVPVYITGITIPVWTEANGQDDIQWYQATKQSDGTYVLNFSPKQHNFESGHYNIHIYGQSQISHSLEGLSSTGGVDLATEKYVVEPTVTVQNHDANGGTLKVRIAESENSKTIKLVRVAAWSESNQSNLHWYTSSDIHDGVVTVMVNEKNHDYIKGDYTVHVYVDFTDNTTSGFNLGTYRLNADKPIHAQSYFIDISSHNGVISVSEYQSLKRQGITGVVVKLTEGTSYTNPYARTQIANAQAAGLRVSAYHYSHYETAAEAKAEAQYFVNAAKSMGLSGATTMVNDMEEQAMLRSDLNANTQAWKDEMNRLGYNNNVYYTMASWLDVKGGKFNTSKFGMSNLWVAHYLYSTQYLDQESAKSLSYYSNSAAWQYTSASPKLSHPLDESIDYTGRFTW